MTPEINPKLEGIQIPKTNHVVGVKRPQQRSDSSNIAQNRCGRVDRISILTRVGLTVEAALFDQIILRRDGHLDDVRDVDVVVIHFRLLEDQGLTLVHFSAQQRMHNFQDTPGSVEFVTGFL